MKYLAFLGMAWLLISNSASAGLILTAVAVNPSSVEAGTPIGLNIFLRSDLAGGELVGGLDFVVHAATTANGTGNGTAGRFSSGSTFLLGSTPIDVVGNGPGQAFSTNFANPGSTVAFADGVGANLGSLYASLTLNTTGVASGGYFFAIDQLAAARPDFSPIAITANGTSFTIQATAVPEPSSLALMGLASCGWAAWRKRRRQ